MADTDSSNPQGGWAPYSHNQTTSTRGTTTGTGNSKLRDSCHACAVSKVKCPKEKPACSRCESRGISCQYFFTRRPGRRRESESSSNRLSRTTSGNSSNSKSNRDAHSAAELDNEENNNGVSKDNDTIQVLPQHAVGANFFPGSPTPPASLSRGGSSYMGSHPGLSISTSPKLDNLFGPDSSDAFSVLEENMMFPELGDFSSEMHDMDFIISGMDSPFGMPEMVDRGTIPHSTRDSDIGSLLMPATKSSQTSTAAGSPEAPTTVSSHSLHSPWKPSMAPSTTSTTCGCVMQALDLLQSLVSTQSNPPTANGSPDSIAISNPTSDISARTVLLENKQGIETVNRMIACPACVHDSFLLTLSSMIVLKILERYATAARTQSHRAAGEAERVSSSAGDADRHGRGRMAAQLVLSELHRVQRLVKQLSPRLKGSRGESGREAGMVMNLWGQGQVEAEGEMVTGTAPFSAGTLDRVESDLRKSLSALSAEIIHMLRQS
ncbi:C6 zinc finger domain protein [Podospora appendiculata]|uniref:C6 zinc finger domain protein n=1 Tax=Podospora appendiculata TaxID=314037 RepID=A0AAE0WY71_9PEZI|nr:C6 zinc finger domain protein [Podospora appendiculata]KAK3681357.1 C6 zinc finger domain protein [Podospora appendiculata]